MHQVDFAHAWTKRLELAPKFITSANAPKRLAEELKKGHLPFLHMSYRAKLEKDLENVKDTLDKFKHLIVLGIGGSALGSRALQKAFYPQQDRPNHNGKSIWIADNIDSQTLEAWFATLDPKETLIVPISKSGGTIETVAQYFLAKTWLQNSLGDAWKDNVIFITDANKGYFREEANANDIYALEVPDNLGGRYSVLSAVGMLPMAFLGVDYKAILDGAASVAKALVEKPEELCSSLAWKMACFAKTLADNDYNQLIFFGYIPAWSCFGAWFMQLWAESLGKNGKGTMPIAALGVTDQHSTQQMFLDGPKDKGCIFITAGNEYPGREFNENLPEKWSWLKGKHFNDLLQAEALGTCMALHQCDVPLIKIKMESANPHAAGALMTLLMATTVFTGWLLEVDPLDQPAVELGKHLANARLDAPGYDDKVSALNEFMQSQVWGEKF